MSARHFDTWWKKARHQTPDLLTLTLDDLLSAAADDLDADAYPEVWTSVLARAGRVRAGAPGLTLSYAFEPGSEADGVTIDIPLKTLNQARPEEFSWQVPGLRLELVTELIRSLPKTLRRELVPAPDLAREILADLDGAVPTADIRDTLSRELLRLRGVRVPPDAFDLDKLPPHLRITFRVLDGAKVVASGKDLAALQRQLRPKVRATLSARATALTRTGVTTWDFGPLPKVFTDGEVKAYPALVDAGGGAVDVRLFETAAAARRRHAGRDQAAGPARREVTRQRGRQAADHRAEARAERQPARLGRRPVRRLRRLRRRRPDQRRRRPRLGRRGVRPDRRHVRPRLHAAAYEVVTWAEEILRGAHEARLRLDGLRSPVARARPPPTSAASSTASSTPASSPRRAPPGCPPSPAT